MHLPASAKVKDLPRSLDWRTIPIPKECPLSAFLAGPPFAVFAHNLNPVSKPCWKRITKGDLDCPWCGKIKLRLIAYVPLVTYRDQARRVVICSKTILPSVESLPTWSAVHCLTPKTKGLPSVIRATDDAPNNSPLQAKLKKRPPEDIREYLFRVLWGIPELCRYFDLEPWRDE